MGQGEAVCKGFRAKFKVLAAHISFSKSLVRQRFLLHTTTYAFWSLSEVGRSFRTLGTSKIQEPVQKMVCVKIQGPIQSFSCPHFTLKVQTVVAFSLHSHYIRFSDSRIPRFFQWRIVYTHHHLSPLYRSSFYTSTTKFKFRHSYLQYSSTKTPETPVDCLSANAGVHHTYIPRSTIYYMPQAAGL